MAVEGTARGGRALWPMVAAAVAVLGAGGAAAYLRWPGFSASPPVPTPASVSTEAKAPAPASPAQAEAKPTAPTFDIVRVSPEGNAVIAGRAQPGAEVVIRNGEQEVARTQADRRGEFVAVPDKQLPAGGHELTLAARGSGGAEVRSEETAVVAVPERRAPDQTQAPQTALALVLPPAGAPPRVLQAAPAPDRKQGLSLNTVDYDEKGAIRFSGSARPSAPLRLYVDNHPVGEAKTDEKGQWTLTPSDTVASGVHQFRVDQLNLQGRVTSRVELPFQRMLTGGADAAVGRVVVQPGQNLWRIARYTYGAGIRYTVIYLANRDQIRDPRLIYPGQIFATPSP